MVLKLSFSCRQLWTGCKWLKPVCGAVTAIGRAHRWLMVEQPLSSDIEVSCDISLLCPSNKQSWTNSSRVVTLQAASGVAGSTALAS